MSFDPFPPPIAVGQVAAPKFDPAPEDLDWRREVSSRIRAHRRRRGFDPGSSLSLGFPESEVAAELADALAAEALAAQSLSEDVQARAAMIAPTNASEEAVEEDSATRYERMARRAGSRRAREAAPEPGVVPGVASGVVIAFPKAATLEMFPATGSELDELAEPLPAVPRILEAPEPEPESDAPQVLSGLHLDPIAAEEQTFESVDVELPLQVAPLGPRFMSALIDTVMVLTAFALFAVIVMSSVQYVPQGKMALLWAVAGPVVFWAAYHYLFLVFGDATPGMVMSQLELSTFDGCFPTRRLRAHRAAALLLSCASLGLGFLWSAFDVDALGWHDRMTRTYLRQS
ncbi:MAG: RDD family protein [Acidobacteriales bacterium]|nr:RDD family protein [Terriglobales bacterium]